MEMGCCGSKDARPVTPEGGGRIVPAEGEDVGEMKAVSPGGRGGREQHAPPRSDSCEDSDGGGREGLLD